MRPITVKVEKRMTRRPAKSDLPFQFNVTLLDIQPKTWRRIQVPDYTLANLHDHVEAAFGWENYHLHEFEIDGERYGPAALDDMDFARELIDQTDVTLGKLIPKLGRKFRCVDVNDFGDGWRHGILFEGFPTVDPKAKYPRCVEGTRACPPEVRGVAWGYTDYGAAICDPKHQQHEELVEWRGGRSTQKNSMRKRHKIDEEGTAGLESVRKS